MRSLLHMGISLCLIIAAAQVANADTIRLGEPGYGGNGCPQGSASVTLSEDQKALSILFDQFVAEAGGQKRTDRKSCNISIPVHVPQGLSVSIFKVDYRGFNSIPSGGRSSLSAEYFFAGSRGPKLTRNFYGPQDQDYVFTNNLEATALVWSACGADVNLRINAGLTAISNSWGEQTLSTVDSADITNGIVYHIQWRRCN